MGTFSKTRMSVAAMLALLLALGWSAAAVGQEDIPGGDPLFYCDYRNQPSQGDVATWWAAAGVSPACANLVVNQSADACTIEATLTSFVRLSSGDYADVLAIFETDALGHYSGGTMLTTPPGGGTLTASFPEGYNNGTAYFKVHWGSPESDIHVGITDPTTLLHWNSTQVGGGGGKV